MTTIIGYAGILAHEKSAFLNVQKSRLQEENCSGIIVETSSSLRRARLALWKLIGDQHTLNRSDILVIYDIDRLASSLILLLEVLERLYELGVHLIAINNEIDTRKSTKFFATIDTLLKFEQEINESNKKAGIAAARVRGKLGGRPTLLDTSERRKAKQLFVNKKLTTKEIAKRLNISIATLYRYFPGGRKNIR